MKEILDNILKSFNTKREGYSSRKLTAFAIVIMVIVTHIKWLTLGNLTQLEMVLSIDYAFIAALFGMTTYHSLKTNGGKDEEQPKVEPPVASSGDTQSVVVDNPDENNG